MAAEGRTALGVVVIDPGEKISGPVETHLKGLSGWKLLGRLPRWEGSGAWVAGLKPAAALLNLDAGWESALAAATEIGPLSPQTVLLGVSEKAKDPGGDWLLRAVRSGIRDFLTFPLDRAEFTQALVRVGQGLGGAGLVSGRVVTFFGAKGGCGLTTVAVNLGIILARQRQKTVGLIDLDLEMGDIAFLLNLSPTVTVAELTDGTRPLEPEALKGALPTHVSGVQVLARPQEIAQAERVSDEGVSRVIEAMRGVFDFVLIDTPHNFTPATLRALDAADTVILLTLPYLPIILETKRALDVFRRLGYTKNLWVVLNRQGPDDDLGVEDVAKAFELPVSMVLPDDYREVTKAANRGLSLWEYAPRSELTRELITLARKLTGEEGEEPKRKRRFRFF